MVEKNTEINPDENSLDLRDIELYIYIIPQEINIIDLVQAFEIIQEKICPIKDYREISSESANSQNKNHTPTYYKIIFEGNKYKERQILHRLMEIKYILPVNINEKEYLFKFACSSSELFTKSNSMIHDKGITYQKSRFTLDEKRRKPDINIEDCEGREKGDGEDNSQIYKIEEKIDIEDTI